MIAAAVLAGVVVGAVLAAAVLGVRLQAARRRAAGLAEQAARDRARWDELAATRRRLSLALGSVAHGIVVFDAGRQVVYRNEPAASFLAARHGDALVEEAIATLAGTAVGGVEAAREVDVFGPPRRTLSLRAVPLGDPAEPVGALVEVVDTSLRRRLENVRRDFVANVSHELKTPVGALVLLAETLLDEDDPEVLRRLSERMASEALRVGNTIDDLLELSRLEASPSGPPGEVVPVARFVGEAADRLRAVADRRGIRLEVEEAPADLAVDGDPRQLVSAVANLLDNAVKYSDAGSSVEVRARRVGGGPPGENVGEGSGGSGGSAGSGTTPAGWVEVEVRDHGIGIPRRDLERIFERFYRVDRARSRETGGTGLGLSIVRHVASNHGGEVRVRSREGQGSRFTLRLPAHAAGPGGGAAEGPGGADIGSDAEADQVEDAYEEAR